MVNSSTTKEYAAVDIFKFICAVLVIIIHTKPFESMFWMDAALGVITRFAVPFFFVSSSIFLFMKIESNPKTAGTTYKKYFTRLLRFYLIWYIVFNVSAALEGHHNDALYYVKQFFFNTSGSPLWFVCALLWSSAMVYVLNKYCSKKIITIISLLLFAIGYIFSTLQPLFANNELFKYINENIISVVGTQNGFFFGMPYVAMGCTFAKYKFKKNYFIDICGIAIFMALLMAESLICVKIVGSTLTYLWISAIPMTYFTVRLMMTIDISSKFNFYFIRKSSTLIYVFHVLILRVVKNAIETYSIANPYNLIYFAGTLTIAIISAGLIVKLSEYKCLKVLKCIM